MLPRGKSHSEQKLRIPFRNRLEKTRPISCFFLCSTHAKLLVYFFEKKFPLTFQIKIENCLKLPVFMKTISK